MTHPMGLDLRSTCLSSMLAAGLWLGGGGPAAAEFSVCNRSFDVLNIAVGAFENGDILRTRGWWTIGPNQCARVIREALPSRFIYVFAKDVFGNPALDGDTQLCLAPKRFVIDGATDCLIRGYLPGSFLEVDTGQQDRWTLFVAPPE
ncbi:MAG: DUF1036 domain-containing protein [Pseudomonadota bacterium]